MKTLYVIRHAKSSWSDPNLPDHDRPLNARGEKDKVVMAKFIRRHFQGIQRVYSSTATRALDYAACINRYTDIPLETSDSLYTFSSAELLEFVNHIADDFSSIALVCHNPAATEIVNHLADLPANEMLTNLPTAAVVKLSFESQSWSEINANSASISDFAKPKALDSFEDDLD